MKNTKLDTPKGNAKKLYKVILNDDHLMVLLIELFAAHENYFEDEFEIALKKFFKEKYNLQKPLNQMDDICWSKFTAIYLTNHDKDIKLMRQLRNTFDKLMGILYKGQGNN